MGCKQSIFFVDQHSDLEVVNIRFHCLAFIGLLIVANTHCNRNYTNKPKRETQPWNCLECYQLRSSSSIDQVWSPSKAYAPAVSRLPTWYAIISLDLRSTARNV